ncbi:hypothetical protein GYMLUDRAFT_40408 [Collybiopsis luxurians FD-317 M1]|uniref:Unplaced genomic scaffold GYMLUscaffold_14, whole genome shotgun sequence n=1 Tax=Collybiopsis luxurians FD-317 M1 TaxID=944289 RepID=A0A0D0BJ18_9AGAR|nr:hypothetical protein GYMLUDRAFT_40408 [Collybiopsis luxurians FD-317 M1]
MTTGSARAYSVLRLQKKKSQIVLYVGIFPTRERIQENLHPLHRPLHLCVQPTLGGSVNVRLRVARIVLLSVLCRQQLPQFRNILPRPELFSPQSHFEFVRCYDGAVKILGINKTILRTSDKHERFNLYEIGQFRRVKFADVDGVKSASGKIDGLSC